MRTGAGLAHGTAVFYFLNLMWGNTLIIDRLISPLSPVEDLRAKEEDKLVLTWEQRRWMRGRFTTVKGRRFGMLPFPTGTPSPGA